MPKQIALALLGAVLLMVALRASAQTEIIGASATGGELVGYAISESGGTVRVENVGAFPLTGDVGHLFGQFIGSADKEVLKIRRAGRQQFAFSSIGPQGARGSKRLRLSRPVGDRYYVLTGFDVDGNGFDDLAIVDISTHRYRWFIVQNPLHQSVREREYFSLGFKDERVEWARSRGRGLEFVSVRQSTNSPRIRALARSAQTG
jgi:hypothetical protein